jgi:hypothetical protein
MGNPTRVSGRITITPPLTWSEFKDSRLLNGRYDESEVMLDVEEETLDTESGQVIRKLATGLVASSEESFNFYDLVEHTQAAIDAFPGREFGGRLDCDSEDGGPWRVEVQDGRAVMVEPKLMWPDDEASFEAAALLKASTWCPPNNCGSWPHASPTPRDLPALARWGSSARMGPRPHLPHHQLTDRNDPWRPATLPSHRQ